MWWTARRLAAAAAAAAPWFGSQGTARALVGQSDRREMHRPMRASARVALGRLTACGWPLLQLIQWRKPKFWIVVSLAALLLLLDLQLHELPE